MDRYTGLRVIQCITKTIWVGLAGNIYLRRYYLVLVSALIKVRKHKSYKQKRFKT